MNVSEQTEGCTHEEILQYSTIHAMTIWARAATGRYEPQQVPCSKVLAEETERWICAACGNDVVPEQDLE
jgi:hypothetical protein